MRGWSLSSELQISRTINGKDDLGPGGYCSTYTVPSSYTSNSAYQQRTRAQLKSMIDGYADEEPDKFFYQLLGKSGAFYFRRQADGSFKPTPVPANGVRIDYNFSSRQFTITDTDGTKYVFSTTKTDWTDDGFSTSHLMAWKCEGVKNAAGVQELTFHYASSYQYTAVSFSDRLEVYDNLEDNVGPYSDYHPMSNPGGWDQQCYLPFWQIAGPKLLKYGGQSSSMLAYNQQGTFQDVGYYTGYGGTPSNSYNTISNSLTTDITFRGGSVVFSYSNGRQLSSIQVKNGDGTTVKTISFTQSYTGSQGGTTYSNYAYLNTRKLDMLQIGDQNYSFTYGLSRQYGNVYDFWGYKAAAPEDYNCSVPYQQIDVSLGNWFYLYDGFSINPENLTIPLTTMIGGGPDLNSIFNLSQVQWTALSITYPTGGKTEFNVGQNSFRDPVDNVVKGAGGYRIENIKYYDGVNVNPVKEKIYKYGPNEDGTGILKSMPSFDPYSGNCFLDETDTYVWESVQGSFTQLNSVRKRTFLSGSTRSLTFSNGAPVNYNEVAEYDSDMGQVTGKTVYKYDLTNFAPEYTSSTDPYPLESEDWDLGMPDSVIQYKYQEGQFRWVHRKNMDYNKFTDPIQIFCGRTSLRGNYILAVPNQYPSLTQDWLTENYGNMQYKFNGIKTGAMQLTSEDESQRDDNGNIITSRTSYFYNNPDPSVVSRIESTGSDGDTTIQNITYPSDYASGDFIAGLITNNIVSSPVEKITRRNDKVISGQLSTYNSNGTIASTYQIESNQLNQSGFRMSNRSSTGDYSPTGTNVVFNRDPAYVQKLALDWDGTYLNLQQVSPVNDIPTTYIWGYNKAYPVAKIVNASLAEVKTALGNSSSLPDLGNGGLLSYQESQLRSNLPNAQVTTYIYSPLIGIISQTDPKGMITYYEYDSLLRLKLIKDQNGNIIKSFDYHYKQ